VRIRRAHRDDAAAVGDVIVAAGRAAWRHIFDTSRMRQDAPRWAAMIGDAERFWVAEGDDDRIVGFAAAGPATDAARGPECGELLMLHVHPDAWGHGVAPRLHDLALFHLARSGRREAVLRTEERNHRALAFYARRGWRPDGTALEREFQGSPLREPWLVRSLDDPDLPRQRPSGDPDVIAFLEARRTRHVARDGELLDAAEFPALTLGEAPRAALTYVVRGPDCEVLTLHAARPRARDGTRLLDALVELAADAGCQTVYLTTTNDNLDALRFYQRRGFRLRAVRPGAVDRSRATVKPQIPRVGAHGIALRDELELERPVGTAS